MNGKCATIEVKDTEKLELKYAALERYCDMIEDDKAELAALLKELEFPCRFCKAEKEQGHAEDCKLHKVLRNYEAADAAEASNKSREAAK